MHVAILPPSSRLHDADPTEIRLKTFQIGPTTHVIPEAPLAAVLWHPLAVASGSADCLITVTTDAAVRLWEIERTNHWSFERPALAIDLRKLADGTSSDQDFEPSGFGRNRGFSADNVDMEAAAACFGGAGAEHEDPWASMTLWTTMTNGDVYALCPLLPSRWTPLATTTAALSISAVARLTTLAPGVSADDENAARQRYEWAQQLDAEVTQFGDETDGPTRLRPSNPSAIPRLQGPFEIALELEDDVEACGIFVIPANLDEEAIFSGEDDYEVISGARSLPFSIICLTSTDNKVHVMIELDGVTGQWLPKKGQTSFSVPTSTGGEFVLLETISLPGATTELNCRPAFTMDPANPYDFYVTTGNQIISVSLEDWSSRVGSEVSDDVDADADNGLQSRLALACQGSICATQTVMNESSASFCTAALFDTIDVGTLLLTSSNSRAMAVQLDQSSLRTSKLLTIEPSSATSSHGHIRQQSLFRASQSLMQVLTTDVRPQMETIPAREPYAPPRVLYDNHMVPVDQLRNDLPPKYRHILTQSPMQMSPVLLGVMTDAHRTLSNQTSHIERAVAELFRRCERLRQELNDQVGQMARLAGRLHQIGFGNESEDHRKEKENSLTHDQKVKDRITAAQTRQKDLFARYERARKRAAQIKSGNKPISTSERGWITEVTDLSKHVGIQQARESDSTSESLSDRLDAAKDLCAQMMVDARRIKEASGGQSTDGVATPEGQSGTKKNFTLGGGSGLAISRFQRERVKEVMEMVEREGTVIEAVRGRLANLGVQT